MLRLTPLDEDTLAQVERVEKDCEARRLQPAPWFGLLRRMYRELQCNGLVEHIEVKQEVCVGCVWAAEDTKGCSQHYYRAHIDQRGGKVMFCPIKTTQAMRDKQLAQLRGKKKRA